MNNSYQYTNTPLYNNPFSYQEYIPLEESYIENILRLNKGKRVSIFQCFPTNTEENIKIFTGIIEQAGHDHLIISDPNSGEYYLILMKYIIYIKSSEEIKSFEQFYPLKK